TLVVDFNDLVAGGPYVVDVHYAGCTNATSQANVPPGQVAQPPGLFALKLGSILGTVVSRINAASTPTVAVQGATVTTTDPSGRPFTTTTDSNGNFFLGGLIGANAAADIDGLGAGLYTVTAASDGQEPSTVSADTTIDNTFLGEDDVVVN